MKGKLNVYKLFIFFVFGINFSVFGQFYSMGEHPSSTKWNQINTENFQLIFDENAEEQAQKVANILTKVYEYVYQNMDKKPSKISIILQNHTTVSNGFVTLAPRRSEFFTTAPQDNDVVDWLGLLAIHEFRHVVQMDKLNEGITKILSFLVGEQGRGFTFGLTVPLWFMEGDAVGTETALTNAGRGRLPSFEMELRTQMLEKGAYSYQKASFGSYKHIVTNHYPFGYFMTSYIKKHYGNETWGNVLKRVGRNPFVPLRFSTALKKETGLRTIDLYKKMTLELDSLWKNQANQLNYTDFDTISIQKNKIPTHYHFPKVQDKNAIFAVKRGFDQIPIFVQLDSLGNEKLIYQPINYNDVSFFANKQKLIWTEIVPDLRWEYRDFSDIKIYDIETQQSYYFFKKTKLFAPTLSPTNELLAAVDYNQLGACQLVVYDVASKERFFELVATWNQQIKNPYFLNENEIVYIEFSEKGNAIKSVNIRSQQVTTYVESQPIFMANPSTNGQYIFFEAAFSGIQNIYAVDIKTKSLFQVTSSKYGASQPSSFEDELYYVDFTINGYQLVKTKIDVTQWKSIDLIQNTSIHYYQKLAEQEGNVNLLSEIPTVHYEVKAYRKWQHLVNIHSWQPISLSEKDDEKVKFGFEVKSQNKLSSTILHYRYQDISNKNLKKHQMDITYNGLYPKMTFSPFLSMYENITLSSGKQYDKLRIQGIEGTIKVPFRYIKNHFYHTYTPFLLIKSVHQASEREGENRQITYSPIEIGGSIIIQLPMCKRDILSKWAFYSTVIYGKTMDNTFNENRMYAKIQGNIPSFWKHHVLRTSVSYEKLENEPVIFQNRTPMPRGYQGAIAFSTAQAIFIDYVFPIAYPDRGIDYLAYFQRIKANLFFDYVQTQQSNYSYGVEIKFDSNFLRYSYLMDVGFRVSKPSYKNGVVVEPLFSISF